MQMDLDRDVSKAVSRVIKRLTYEINQMAMEGKPIDFREAARWGHRTLEAQELARSLAEFAEAITRPLEKRIEALERRLAGGPPTLQ